MRSDILVSVVIPTYNAEKYLKECLNATLRQTYSNLEIIIIDDGSTDSTRDICRSFAEKDDRIKLLFTSTHRVSAARNIGIENARGRYITFFDHDDRPEPKMIEYYLKAHELWSNKEISFITTGIFFDNDVNKNVDNRVCILEAAHGYIEGECYLLKRNYAAVLAWLRIFNFVTNKLYDNEIIKTNGIRFNENIQIGEENNIMEY